MEAFMELFQYLMNPVVQLGVVIGLNIVRAFKVITWSWWIVNIPTIVFVIFWIVAIIVLFNYGAT